MESKLKSRTFWLAIMWTFMAGFGLVVAAFGKTVPLSALIGSAGLVTAAYVGGEKLIDNTKFRNNGN
jgi:hypothetical protein